MKHKKSFCMVAATLTIGFFLLLEGCKSAAKKVATPAASASAVSDPNSTPTGGSPEEQVQQAINETTTSATDYLATNPSDSDPVKPLAETVVEAAKDPNAATNIAGSGDSCKGALAETMENTPAAEVKKHSGVAYALFTVALVGVAAGVYFGPAYFAKRADYLKLGVNLDAEIAKVTAAEANLKGFKETADIRKAEQTAQRLLQEAQETERLAKEVKAARSALTAEVPLTESMIKELRALKAEGAITEAMVKELQELKEGQKLSDNAKTASKAALEEIDKLKAAAVQVEEEATKLVASTKESTKAAIETAEGAKAAILELEAVERTLTEVTEKAVGKIQVAQIINAQLAGAERDLLLKLSATEGALTVERTGVLKVVKAKVPAGVKLPKDFEAKAFKAAEGEALHTTATLDTKTKALTNLEKESKSVLGFKTTESAITKAKYGAGALAALLVIGTGALAIKAYKDNKESQEKLGLTYTVEATASTDPRQTFLETMEKSSDVVADACAQVIASDTPAPVEAAPAAPAAP